MCLAKIGKIGGFTTWGIMDGVPDSILWETLVSWIGLNAKDSQRRQVLNNVLWDEQVVLNSDWECILDRQNTM